MIVSPCISICKTDPITGYCYGCARSEIEKKIWKDPKTSDEWKKNNIEELKKRMNGWQLESFIESYEHKNKNGISLFKKKLINETK
jgi:Predicted Fe-S protein